MGTTIVGVPIDATSGAIIASSGLILPKTAGTGFKVDTSSGVFPWHDIIGDVRPKTSGANTPALAAFRGGNVQAYAFVLNDVIDFTFHIPHDYVPGSDLYWHIHWAHNGTNISGTFTADSYVTYAKGHNQANFSSEITATITYDTVNLATTPQYRHRIDEVQLSAATPNANQLDSDDIEVDGMIIVRTKVTGLPTVTGGNLFILFGDLHYQSTGMGTKGKSPTPGFWT